MIKEKSPEPSYSSDSSFLEEKKPITKKKPSPIKGHSQHHQPSSNLRRSQQRTSGNAGEQIKNLDLLSLKK
jgi:poly-gamma-glutamate capsule biosynthesis protein CapA/YwtB (metallophosphatase superfamily)